MSGRRTSPIVDSFGIDDVFAREGYLALDTAHSTSHREYTAGVRCCADPR